MLGKLGGESQQDFFWLALLSHKVRASIWGYVGMSVHPYLESEYFGLDHYPLLYVDRQLRTICTYLGINRPDTYIAQYVRKGRIHLSKR